jgi:O-antigen biosynthesis protein WbqP
VKRAVDILAALALGVVALFVVSIAMIAIRLESPGSPVFAQKRVGRGERVFTCYKLRTMLQDTGEQPSHNVDRSAITRVGAFLRHFKVDELPQLVNVLRGEMSLVGPRPCLPSQHELIEARRRRGVFAVLPGITGLAQIRGVDMSDPERLASLDQEYVDSRSLIGDLRLLLQTAVGHGHGDPAIRG